MHTHALSGLGGPDLLMVQAQEEIEYLVKECEVLTGHSGRTFVISGADRLIYRVHWQPSGMPNGLAVERLDEHCRVQSRQHLQFWELLEHSLVAAQAAGQLFTPPVRRLD